MTARGRVTVMNGRPFPREVSKEAGEADDMNEKPKLRVAIVYQYVAHYREPIFKRLSADRDVEYTVFSDSSSNIGSLAVMNFGNDTGNGDTSIRRKGVKNHWFFNSLLWQSGVLSIAFRKHFDVIIYLGDVHYLSTWVSAAVARMSGKRVLFWGHGFKTFESGIRSIIKKLFFRIPNGHLLYGNIGRDYLIHSGFKSDDLYVVYNSLDFEAQKSIYSGLSEQKIRAVRERLFDDPDAPLLVSIGRIDRYKRLDILVEAVDILRREGFAANLLIIGDGPDRNNVERLAAGSESAKSIAVLGAIYGERNLGELIGAADLCVVSGPVGLVIVHAFGYGVPVIAHDRLRIHNPEFELMTPGRTGDLYEEGNARSLAHAARQWLERNPDRAEVAGRCREMIERFYNPAHQHRVIDHAVHGRPASELPTPNGAHHWILRKTWPPAALERLAISMDYPAP
jgi:glycosyltransferase involved in cell wall biosynthesis